MKPRVKFYTNGQLIPEATNEYSLRWFQFIQYRAIEAITLKYLPDTSREYKLAGFPEDS